LVKNEAIGVNHVDLSIRAGEFPSPVTGHLGIEGAGIVEELGSEVEGISVGDRVGYFNFASYGEYAIVERARIVKLPNNVSSKTAVTIPLQGLTALTMVKGIYKIKKGDVVLVYAAAGGTGQQLVKLSSYFGASVIAVTSTEEKSKLAIELGAQYAISYKTEDVSQRVYEITNGKGVDVVFDSIGKFTFNINFTLIAKFGTIVNYGSLSGEIDPVNISQLVEKSVSLLKNQIFKIIQTSEELEAWSEELFKLYQRGVILDRVYKTYSLKGAKQAHRDLDSGKTKGKLLLLPN
jgi:NADPH2:quinone reductase